MEIRPKTPKVLLGIGANLGDPYSKLIQTIDAIEHQIGPLIGISRFYLTEPMNPPALETQSQPDFLNAVIACRSNKRPNELMRDLLMLESSLGRKRENEIKWGPRVIDIDLLSANFEIVNSSALILPHPGIEERDFVLYPLREADPEYVHPLSQLSIEQMIYNYHARGNPNRIIGVYDPESAALSANAH